MHDEEVLLWAYGWFGWYMIDIESNAEVITVALLGFFFYLLGIHPWKNFLISCDTRGERWDFVFDVGFIFSSTRYYFESKNKISREFSIFQKQILKSFSICKEREAKLEKIINHALIAFGAAAPSSWLIRLKL